MSLGTGFSVIYLFIFLHYTVEEERVVYYLILFAKSS